MSTENQSTSSSSKQRKKKISKRRRKKQKDFQQLINGGISDKRLRDVIQIYGQPAIKTNEKTDKAIGHDYKRENLEMMRMIIEAEPSIKASHFEKLWKQSLTQIVYKAKYPYILPRDHCFDIGLEDTEFLGCNCKCLSLKRTKIFLEFAVENEHSLGRMKILLFDDIVPKTVENFIKLIRNFKKSKNCSTDDSRAKEKPHLIGTRIHRVFPGVFAEMGDITDGNGLGGLSATGENFKEENFDLPVNYTGALAMIPVEKGMVNSQFLITFRPVSGLNGKRVVFGRMMKGLRTLRHIEGLGRNHGRPIKNIIISNCGLL